MDIKNIIVIGEVRPGIFNGNIDPDKLASYLQEEREAREALEKRVEDLAEIVADIDNDLGEHKLKHLQSTPSIDKTEPRTATEVWIRETAKQTAKQHANYLKQIKDKAIQADREKTIEFIEETKEQAEKLYIHTPTPKKDV